MQTAGMRELWRSEWEKRRKGERERERPSEKRNPPLKGVQGDVLPFIISNQSARYRLTGFLC
jgi:hypothetical protein